MARAAAAGTARAAATAVDTARTGPKRIPIRMAIGTPTAAGKHRHGKHKEPLSLEVTHRGGRTGADPLLSPISFSFIASTASAMSSLS